MASKSNIEWTEQTWNPIVGCSIVSPGCTNCYAMKMAARIEAMGNQPRYAGSTRKVNGNAIWTGKLAQAPKSVLLAPLRRKKPTTYFVNSMGDLFHEDCPDEWIDQVFAVMALTPQHTYQVLTKRAERMRRYMSADGLPTPMHRMIAILVAADAISPRERKGFEPFRKFSLPNVWLGVSTERQQEADERIPLLLQTPAAVRFISAEPLLGPIDIKAWLAPKDFHIVPSVEHRWVHWVITGGESGPGARPANPQWYRDIRDQCAAAGAAFFHKQNGAWVSVSEVEGAGEHFSFPDGRTVRHVGKAKAGRLLDGVEHNGMPGRIAA